MNTLLEEDQRLPEGLWLVKWIDCFTMTRGFMHSPRVHLVFQKLRSDDPMEIERLSQDVISYEVLGRYPNQPVDDKPEWEVRKVLAGLLPLLTIGDVFQGTQVVTRLRARVRTIEMDRDTPSVRASVMAEREAPSDWTGSYRVLNKFEFELGKQREVTGAKCLTISARDGDYVIPATVIFKTFYGFHTAVANAFCNGPWQTHHRDVISTSNFESGLRTSIDEATGDWHIVVETGLTRAHAVRLAVLLFDPHGYACACEINEDARRQNQFRRADDERFWFANARIPYTCENQPFLMRVSGFPLRPLRVQPGTRTRFLVTSIDEHTWPHVQQVIHSEMATSNARSNNPKKEKEPRPYWGSKPPPVPADPKAQADHHHDPDQKSAINQAFEGSFRFMNEPDHRMQLKESHKQYPPAPPRPKEGPSSVVSAGIETSGDGNPAPLTGDSRERCPSQQLQFLLTALDTLLDNELIDSYTPLAPPVDSRLRAMRNGIPCWSFLSEGEVRKRGTNTRGWEFINEEVKTERMGSYRSAYPRCLLIVRVLLRGQEIVLFEVEPRRSDNGYCTYIMAPTVGYNWMDLESIVERVRRRAGRVNKDDLQQVFERVSSKPTARKHAYLRRDDDTVFTGLDSASLLRKLEAAVAEDAHGSDVE